MLKCHVTGDMPYMVYLLSREISAQLKVYISAEQIFVSFLCVMAAVLQYVVLGLCQFIASHYCKELMHDSALSGCAWLNELLVGNPSVFHIYFDMSKHVFLALVIQLHILGYDEKPNAHVLLDEVLAIFLHTCVTELSVDHVAVWFQHSKSTISEYFQYLLS